MTDESRIKSRSVVRASYRRRISVAISKKDRLIPIISLVFYYGSEPWDGPVDLYDMFRLEGTKEEKEILEKYLPNYKINLVDAERLEDVEKFSDDLQVILTMLRYRDSKEELKHYIDENKKFFRMLIMKQVRR